MKTWNSSNSEMELGRELAPNQQFGEAMAHDYWQRFAKTGNISDYLKYTAHSRGEHKQEDLN